MTRCLAAMRALLLCVCLFAAAGAAAQYSCAVAGPGAVSFLVYNPAAGTPAQASTSVTLTCTHVSGGAQRVDWTMELSNGGSGNCNARWLAGAGDTLNYNIYQDSIAGGVWGNAGCATFPAGRLMVGPGAGNNTRSETRTLFGQIPIGQYVSAGSYSDTLTLTITY